MFSVRVAEHVEISGSFAATRRLTSVTATAHLKPFKLFKLDEGPASTTTCSREDALKFYEMMQRIRFMETSLGTLYMEKKVRGFCHLYIFQEAEAVGIEAALIPGDAIVSTYRCHGYTITRGESVASVIGELMGKSNGNCAGKSGSMHLYSNEFYGGHGIVAAQVPLGAGIALHKKLNGTNNVCVAIYGEGASNQGQVFETLNMAKLWNLPCIFVCENNKFGMSTSAQRSSSNTAFYTRGDVIPGIWADGMDVLTVREVMRYATNWCRSGKGPIIVELDIHRLFGHSMIHPDTGFNSQGELEAAQHYHDPIIHFGRFMTENGLATHDEIKTLDKKIRLEVEQDVVDCENAPDPEIETAYTNVYRDKPANFYIRGVDITQKIFPKA